MILTDHDVKAGLVGLPCYIQSMIGFACMFLAKLTSIHGDELIERKVVVDLISRLVVVYRATPVGKWHLVPLMADGLEKLVGILQQNQHSDEVTSSTAGIPLGGQQRQMPTEAIYNLGAVGQLDISTMNLDPQFLMDTTNMGMGMGMGLGGGAPDQSFFGDEFGFGQGLM